MSENHETQSLAAGGNEGHDGVCPVGSSSGVAEISDDSVNQVDDADSTNENAPDTTQSDSTDTRTGEDAGREDMFVDCQDEMENSESQQSSEDKDDAQSVKSKEPDDGLEVHDLLGEVQQLRKMHERSVAENDRLSHEYEEERAVLARELAQLFSQVKALNAQQSLASEGGEGLVDSLPIAGNGAVDEKVPLSGASLHEMISMCSNLLEDVLDERFQSEGRIKELNGELSAKDGEISRLNAVVAELCESNNIQSDLNSKHDHLSQLYQAQLEMDQHVNEIVNRILAYLPMTGHEQELLDEPLTGKISRIEMGIVLLTEKHKEFLSEIDQLRWCLTEVASDFSFHDELGIIVSAREKLLELSRNEVDLRTNLTNLDEVNRNLLGELDKQKEILESANAEISRLGMEVEQEKTRYANTKEKLSMAVTKGKALVQQRDTLKQSLAEKTSQLEQCLVELQEKSIALEAAEKNKELLASSESLVASLQESLLQKETILQNCEKILSEVVVTEELQSTDIIKKVKWLTDERKSLADVSQEYNNIKDAISQCNFPEPMLPGGADAWVRWLVESFHQSKEEAERLKHLIAETEEAAKTQIDQLTSLLLVETQERSYLQAELEDFRLKSEEIVQKEYQVSLQRDQLISMLIEASGIAKDGQEEIFKEQSDGTVVIEKCLEKLREESYPDSSQVMDELLESFQSLLYTRDLELRFYEQIVGEDTIDRMELSHLSNELQTVAQEHGVLKEEKAVLQKNLDQLEDKNALIREKLSMAVKKGKGLVQERENLKGTLKEKNTEIEKLKAELQQQVSAHSDCKDTVSKLSLDVERIPQLEADLVELRKHGDQLEHFLAESKGILQKVMESIDGITPPGDLVFGEPVEKVKWLAGYFSELEAEKMKVEEELRKKEEEAGSLSGKYFEVQTKVKSLEDALSEAGNNLSLLQGEKKELEVAKIHVEEELQRAIDEVQTKVKSLEDALSEAANNISLLQGEKNELEVAKIHVEEELQRAIDEASSEKSNFEEVRRSLEYALSQAQSNTSGLMNEREVAIESRTLLEAELHKLMKEVSVQTGRLSDADKTIKSLEEALSEAQTNISLLSEENNKVRIGRVDLENEMMKLKEEVNIHTSKLSDASLTIKSLETALSDAEKNMANLIKEKKNAEQEIFALNSKLNACMQELAGTHGNIEARSMELYGHISSLEMFLKDETLFTLLQRTFEKKFAGLKDMDLLLKEMKDHFLKADPNWLQNSPAMQDSITLPPTINGALDMKMVNGDVSAADPEVQMGKLIEGFRQKEKILADKFKGFSAFLDELIADLLRKLQVAKDGMISTLEIVKSLKKAVNDAELDRQRQEDTSVSLESDTKTLLAACSDAIHELESDVQNNILALRSVYEVVNLDGGVSINLETVGENAAGGHQLEFGGNRPAETTEKLLAAARHSRGLSRQFQEAMRKLLGINELLQSELKETKLTYDQVLGERDQYQDRIFKLETDLGALQNLCDDMTIRLKDSQAKEDELKEREAELSSLYSTSLTKLQESKDSLLSASEVQSLFDKINKIDIPVDELEVGGVKPHDSSEVQKLFHMIDIFGSLQEKVSLLSHEKEEIQSALEKQMTEAEYLKNEIEDHVRNAKDVEKRKNESLARLENVIRKLGGDQLINDQKVADVIWLLQVLEKLVVDKIVESESFKSQAEELGAKLLGAQKVVDDLSNKIKSLEDSNQARIASRETSQERVVSAASGPSQSEISEVQEMGALGTSSSSKNIPAIPTAAHARTLKKGSSDHLAINIDSDSERLVNSEEADADKGHVFKSLNTSGLIPRQGRMFADRVDSVWVSSGRALMSHPRARVGVIAYWLVLHLWLLGTIL